MQNIRQAIQIIQSDGLSPFLRAVFRFIYWNLGVRTAYLKFRHKASGSQVDVTVQNATATMTTTTFPEFERFYGLKSEQEVLEDILTEISAGDTIYDIGANVGLYSCLIGSKEPNCMVYSFEPHPTNVEALSRNLKLNNVKGKI